MAATYEGWAIVELMGHRRLAANVSEATIAGAAFLRLDVPSDPPVTQYYGPSAIYAITPTTEELARRFATRNRPAPVHRYELPDKAESTDQDADVVDVSDGEDDGPLW